MKNKKRKGFTLPEILAVVAILILLVGIAIPGYERLVQKSEVSDALHNLDMLTNAQNKYFMSNGRYTRNLSSLDTPLRGSDVSISTANFTYFAGKPSGGNTCVYSKSVKNDYTLAWNYKTHEGPLCSGSFCSQINETVPTGSLTSLCGTGIDEDCDLVCESPKVLDEDECICVCEDHCGEYAVQNAETCECRCLGQAILADDGKNCKCPSSVEEGCISSGKRYDSSICDCSDCDLVESDCTSVGKILNLSKCICEDPLNSCEKTCPIGKILDREACECVCGEVLSCDGDHTFNNDTCRCECNYNAASCTAIGKVFDEESCACVCSPASIHDCSSPYQELQNDCSCKCNKPANFSTICGANHSWDNEICNCKCTLTVESCVTPGYVVDPNTCTCIPPEDCTLKDSDCPTGQIVNAEKCMCEDSLCSDPGTCHNGTWNYRNCECVCGLTEEYCREHGNRILDASACECTNCAILEKECTEEGKVLNSETCSCQCPQSAIDACDSTEYQELNQEDCSCTCNTPAPGTCPGHAIFNSDPSVCACECNYTCGASQELNEETCECGCTLDEEQCKDKNENYIFNSERCKCECGIDADYCTSQNENYTFVKKQCQCKCNLTDEGCQRTNSNPYYAVNNETSCQCACSSTLLDAEVARRNSETGGNRKGPFWEADMGSCRPTCPITGDAWCSSYGANYLADTGACVCYTALCDNVEECHNGHYDYHECKCVCDLDDTACGLQGKVLDPESCDCKEPCALNPEECVEPFVFTASPFAEACSCDCGLSDDKCYRDHGKVLDNPTSCQCICGNSCGDGYMLNEENCECDCNKDDNWCKTHNGNNAHYVFEAPCGCTCDLTTESCGGGNWEVSSACVCVCPSKIATECAKIGKEFDSTHCECSTCSTPCPYPHQVQNQEDCSCTQCDDLACTGNWVKDPSTCECTCPASVQTSCTKQGKTFNAETCSCGDCSTPCPYPHQVQNPSTCECTCDGASCPGNWEQDPTTCNCTVCPGSVQTNCTNQGKSYNAGTCSCGDCNGGACPSEYQYRDPEDNCQCKCNTTSLNNAVSGLGGGWQANTTTCLPECPDSVKDSCEEQGKDFNGESCSCGGCSPVSCAPDKAQNMVTCDCECVLTNSTCSTRNGNNTNWIANNSSCSCECSHAAVDAAVSAKISATGSSNWVADYGSTCGPVCPASVQASCVEQGKSYNAGTCSCGDCVGAACPSPYQERDPEEGCKCKCNTASLNSAVSGLGGGWQANTTTCLPECPGSVKDSCEEQGRFYDGTACICGSCNPVTCGGYQTQNQTNCQCECSHTLLDNEVGLRGEEWQANYGTCQPTCPVTGNAWCVSHYGANYVADTSGNHCRCVCGGNDTCADQHGGNTDWHMDGSCSCFCDKTSAECQSQNSNPNYIVNGDCNCVCNTSASCGSGKHIDVGTCGCVCDTTFECGANKDWDPSTCACGECKLTGCPAGKVLVEDEKDCYCDDSCKVNCTLPKIKQDEPCGCICGSYSWTGNTYGSCPDGTAPRDSDCTCECSSSCSSPKELNSECDCVCPYYTKIGDATHYNSCPSGFDTNSINCTCDCNITCKSGETRHNDTCTCTCDKTPYGNYIVNDDCEYECPASVEAECTSQHKVFNAGTCSCGDCAESCEHPHQVQNPSTCECTCDDLPCSGNWDKDLETCECYCPESVQTSCTNQGKAYNAETCSCGSCNGPECPSEHQYRDPSNNCQCTCDNASLNSAVHSLGGGWQANYTTCLPECPSSVQDECIAQGKEFNAETCSCGSCTPMSCGGYKVQNETTCDCECSETLLNAAVTSLGEEWQANYVTCQPSCPITGNSWCQSVGGYDANYIADTSGDHCRCVCGNNETCAGQHGGNTDWQMNGSCDCYCSLNDTICASRGGNSRWHANTAGGSCACECSKIELDNYIASLNVSGAEWAANMTTCDKECPTMAQNTCEDEGKDFNVSTCTCGACAPISCGGTDEAQNPETCDCECVLTNGTCASRNGGNTNWVANSGSCSCMCSQDAVDIAVSAKISATGSSNWEPDYGSTCGPVCPASVSLECSEAGKSFDAENCRCGVCTTDCAYPHQIQDPDTCECDSCETITCTGNRVQHPTTCECYCPDSVAESCAAQGKSYNAENCSCSDCLPPDPACTPYWTQNPSTCGCTDCTITDSFCSDEHGGNTGWIAKTTGGHCECECKIKGNVGCATLHGGNTNWLLSPECECYCKETAEAECKAKGSNFEYIPGECLCRCKAGCPEGSTQDPETCECSSTGCDKVPSDCTSPWVLNADPEVCACECGKNNYECEGNWTVNQELCDCSNCPLTNVLCAKNNGNNENYKANLTDCVCECGIDSCPNLKELEGCNCVCNKTSDYCKTTYGSNYTMNTEDCVCVPKDCALSAEQCKLQNENYSFNAGLCRCECNEGTEAKCIAMGMSFDAENCACVPLCNWDLERCRDVYNNNYIFNSTDCSCECGLTNDVCRNEGGVLDHENCECVPDCPWSDELCKSTYNNSFMYFNATECECECRLTDGECKGINANWIALPDCTCGCRDTATCTDPYTAWNPETCDCEPATGCVLTGEYCKSLNPNYVLTIGHSGNCQCSCGLTKYSPCPPGLAPVLGEACACLSKCAINFQGGGHDEYTCSLEGMALNMTRCQCEPSSCPCTGAGCAVQNAYCVDNIGPTAFYNMTTCDCSVTSSFTS